MSWLQTRLNRVKVQTRNVNFKDEEMQRIQAYCRQVYGELSGWRRPSWCIKRIVEDWCKYRLDIEEKFIKKRR